MPLPATTERAARAVARVLADLDDQVARYLAGRDRLPSPRAVLDELRPLVTAAVSAAMRDIDPDVPLSAVTDAVDEQLTDLQAAITGTVDQARAVRRRLPTNPPVREDGEAVTVFVRRVGKFAALAALLAADRGRRGGRVGTPDVSKVARQVSVRVPRRTAGYGRMVVRTKSAVARNVHAADVVDARMAAAPTDALQLAARKAAGAEAQLGARKAAADVTNQSIARNRASADRAEELYRAKRRSERRPGVSESTGPKPGDWVLLIRDGLKGPTDADCEEVDGLWATPKWLRNHPVEHPNCTRVGRPKVLPAGEAVTLLE